MTSCINLNILGGGGGGWQSGGGGGGWQSGGGGGQTKIVKVIEEQGHGGGHGGYSGGGGHGGGHDEQVIKIVRVQGTFQQITVLSLVRSQNMWHPQLRMKLKWFQACDSFNCDSFSVVYFFSLLIPHITIKITKQHLEYMSNKWQTKKRERKKKNNNIKITIASLWLS